MLPVVALIVLGLLLALSWPHLISAQSTQQPSEVSLAEDNEHPSGIWSDGTTMWVADISDARLYAYTLASGARQESREFDLHTDNGHPKGVWSDGTTMWVGDDRDDRIYAYTLSGTDKGDRQTAREFDLATENDNAQGLWSDGTTIWVVDTEDDKLYAYALAGGERQTAKEFDLASVNTDPRGVWHSGGAFWVADRGDAAIYAYVSTLGHVRQPGKELALPSGNPDPQGIWSDGTTMWVVDFNADKLIPYDMADRIALPVSDPVLLLNNVEPRPLNLWTLGSNDMAQAFTTGSHSGYTLNTIDLRLDFQGSPSGDFTVALHTSVNGRPGARLATLTAGGLGTGIGRFTPSAPIDLDADTTYFVVVDSSTAFHKRVTTLARGREDAVTGWSVDSSYLYRNRGSDGDWTVASVNQMLQVRLIGVVRGLTSLTPSFGNETVTAQTYAQDERIATEPLPAATGGDGALTYSITPALPAGLSFNPVTRRISGTPTAAQDSMPYSYRAKDTDGDFASLRFTITVAPPDLMPEFLALLTFRRSYVRDTNISGETLPEATGGNGTLTYSIEPDLPVGLSFDPATRVLGGRPTVQQPPTYYVYKATDADGDEARQQLTITVTIGTAPTFGNETITAQQYVQDKDIGEVTLPAASGGDGTLTYSIEPELPAGLSFDPATRKLGGAPGAVQGDTTYTYQVADIDGDRDRIQFAISVSAAPPRFLLSATELRVPEGGSKSYTFRMSRLLDAPIEVVSLTVLSYPGETVTGVSVSPDGFTMVPSGYDTLRTVTVTAAEDSAVGHRRVRVRHQVSVQESILDAYLAVRVLDNDGAPSFAHDASIGDKSYVQDTAIESVALPVASGGSGTLSYSITPALPAGLMFDTTTRTLSGTPTVAKAETAYTYRVTDGAGNSDTLAFSIRVRLAELVGLTVSPVSGDTTKLAVSWTPFSGAEQYLVQWKTGDADYNDGATVSTASHTITGLSADTTYAVQVTAIDTDADPDRNLARAEGSGATSAAGTTDGVRPNWKAGQSFEYVYEAKVGVAFSVTLLEAEGGTGTLTYSLTPETGGALPPDMNFNASTRTLSGTPTAGMALTGYRYTATDSDGDKISVDLAVAVGLADLQGLTFKPVHGDATKAVVSWTAYSGAEQYLVQWKKEKTDKADFPEFNSGTTVATTRHTISGLTAGDTYTVRVTAIDADADPDGDLARGEADGPALAQLADLQVSTPKRTTTELSVRWTAFSGADQYLVQWKIVSGSFNDGQTVTGRTHMITGLTENTRYDVRVIAVDTDPDPDVAVARAVGIGRTLPELKSLTVSAVSGQSTQLSVSWAKVTGAAGYIVQWKTGSDDYSASERRVNKTGADTTSHTITDLTAATAYTVRVSAYTTGNAADPDGAFAEESATTNADADSSPSFADGASIDNQSYARSIQIAELTLPQATGGDGTLTYSITTALPAGLTFDTTTRILSGTPTAAQGATNYTYRVTDGDGDQDSLTFSLAVVAEPTLVSNLSEPFTNKYLIWDFDHAQGFTTGGNKGGYRLTQVELPLEFPPGNKTTFDVSIYTSVNGQPGTLLGTLIAPDTLMNLSNVFTHSGLDLSANTEYFVFIDTTTVLGVGFVRNTGSTEETGLAGWTIGDNLYVRPPLSTGSWRSENVNMFIGIGGWPKEAASAGVSASLSQVTIAEVDTPRTKKVREDQAAWTVQLDTDPGLGNTATVTLGTAAAGVVTVEPTTLSFTGGVGGTWYRPQRVTVTALDDDIDNPNDARVVSVTHMVANYGSVTSGDPVSVTVNDDDQAGFRFQRRSVHLREFDDPDTAHLDQLGYYRIRLTSQPTANVTLNLTASETGSIRINPATVTFTPSRWSAYRTINVTAVNSTGKGDRVTTISHAVSGAGSGYESLDPGMVRVVIDDPNDTRPQWTAGSFNLIQEFEVAVAVNLTLPAATGDGTLTYSLTPEKDAALPPGLDFNTTTRTLSGTPTEALALTGYRYAATDGDGDTSSFDFAIAVTDTGRLFDLSGLTVSPVAGDVTKLAVSWMAFSGAEQYLVQHRTGDGSFNAGTTVTDARHTISGLSADTTYTVRVTAIDTDADPDANLARGQAEGKTHAILPGFSVAPAAGESTKLTVSWDTVTDATNYVVQWKSGNQAYDISTRRVVEGAAATSYDITGLTANTAYDVRVLATTSAGPLAIAEGSATTHRELTGLTVTAVDGSSDSLEASWMAVTGATGYRVEWKTGDRAYAAVSRANETAVSETITGLSADTEYTVRVTARVTVGGTTVDGDSAEAMGATNAGLTLAQNNLIDDRLKVTWTPSTDTGVTGYLVQWKSGSESYSTTERSHTAGPSDSMHEIDGLALGVYMVRVTQQGGAGDGTSLGEATVTLHGWPGVVYVDPVAGDARAIDVEWEKVSTAAGYVIQWRKGSDSGYPTANRATVAADSVQTRTGTDFPVHRVTGLEPNTVYHAKVSVYTDAGTAAAPDGHSHEDFGTTHGELTGLTAVSVAGEATSLDVSWTAPVTTVAYFKARGYRVQWKTTAAADYPQANVSEVTGAVTHKISGLTTDTEYTVKVTVLGNWYGIHEDGDAAEASGTPGQAVPGVSLSATAVSMDETDDASTTGQREDQAEYTVALDTQPAGTVTVAAVVPNRNIVTVSPSSVAFSTSSWSMPKTFTVTAVNDSFYGDRAQTISHTVSGYGDVTSAADVMATVRNDDARMVRVNGLILDPSQALTVLEADDPGTTIDESSVTITVRLSSRPTSFITRLRVDGSGAATARAVDQLTFSRTDYANPRRVDVAGSNDDVVNPGGQREGVVWIYRSPADAPIGSIPVTVLDDDLADLQNLSVSAVTGSTTSLDVSWTAYSGAEKYLVQHSDGSAPFTVGTTVTTNSHRTTGLSAGTTYVVLVTAIDTGTGSDVPLARSVAEGTTNSSPTSGGESGGRGATGAVEAAVLTGLTVDSVSGEPTHLAVSWDALDGAAKYSVRWKTGSDGYGSPVETTDTSHTIMGLTAGTTYTVNVAALGADNTLLAESVGSGATARQTGGASGQQVKEPAALDGLTVNPVAGKTTELAASWNTVDDADRYLVRWKTGDADYNSGTTVTTNGHTITGLSAYTAYTVRVTAVDTDADPDAELAVGEAGGTTLDAMGTVSVAAVSDSGDSLDVSWPAVNGATDYKVEWKTGGGSYAAVARADAAATRERVTCLAAETAYTVRVTARHTIGGEAAAGDSAVGSGTTNGAAAAELPSVCFVIYHDPDAGAAEVDRYNEGVKLLTDAGISYSEVKGDIQADVDRLAGVTDSVMPRFFLGDPTGGDWISEPRVNNGGLRWLKEKVAELSQE